MNADFWHAPSIDIRLNPRVTLDTTGLADFIRDELNIHSAIVLATSGTTGSAKFVVLEKNALLTSARAVNAHLNISENDRWLAALTLFHVGGLQISARAALSGSQVITVDDPLAWDKSGDSFVKTLIAHNISITALTPVHLHDLVKNNHHAPESLRGILIGGGGIAPEIAERALTLHWPIWTTYGMTESCSQIATATDPNAALTGWLPIIDGWEARISEDDAFSIRGDALFSAYITRADTGQWIGHQPFDSDGWFATNDRMQLSENGHELKFRGRSDQFVKSMGELVSIQKLEQTLSESNLTGVVIPVPDARRGHRFVAFIETDVSITPEAVNDKLAPFEHISEFIALPELPRTAVGKIAKNELRQLLK